MHSFSIPMFYKYSGANKFITNSTFDEFFGSSRKKVLDNLNSLNFTKNNKFELEVEDDLGRKVNAISYISKVSEDGDDKLGIIVDVSEQNRAKDAITVLKERYELATKGSNEGLWDWNIDSDELYTSVKFKEILGVKGLSKSLKSWISLIQKDDRRVFIAELEKHLNGRSKVFKCEHRVEIDGELKWFLARGKIAQDGKNVKRVVGFLTDISDIKTAQLALAQSQEQFELFMKNLPAAAYIQDLNDNFIFSNKYINDFFGVDTLVGKSLSEVFSPKELQKIKAQTKQLMQENIVSSQTALVDRFDVHRYFHTNRFLLSKGEQSLIGGIYTDITSQKMTEKKLNKLAHYDLLTNLPNRALFYNSLTNSISKAKRNGTKVALMFIDLDNFKNINDTLGHDYGDILLKEVAEKLKSVLRAEDVVSRLGGDEFTVVLDDITDTAYPSVVAQKIIDALAKPIKLKDEMGYIGSSIGITIFPDDAADMDTLIKNADMAMYAVKGAGKNTFRYFTEEMDSDSREKMELTNDLRSAVINNELEMYYQPIVDVQYGGLALFEALVRWEHPKYGLITPEYFIHLAEEGGFMVKIGRWILTSVCQKIKQFQDRGYDIKIAANVSSKQLTQNHLEQTTKDIIKKTGIKPELLELEVTEGFLMENIQKVEEVLSNLRDFGVGISIDDFGTGYSSLSRLKSLPITKLKIDKSFVDDVIESESDRKIFKVIISLAKGLGLEVVSEGVETKEQFEFVQNAGCDLVQGYYFSKPLSSKRVDKFLEDVM